jgi:hypothetical protein
MAANPNPAFFKTIRNPFKFKLFLLQKLPAAFMASLRLRDVSANSCMVSVPYKWATQNPFRSTYFACLAMAAEMSTGVLAMAHVYGRRPSISMLIGGMESKFHKKATGLTLFTCNDGAAIQQVISQAVQSDEGQTIRVYSKGENNKGELVAEFWFTWSFKAKKEKNSNV